MGTVGALSGWSCRFSCLTGVDGAAFGFLVPPEVDAYRKGEKDPDLADPAPGEESDDEDLNDLTIKDTDAVLVAATTEVRVRTGDEEAQEEPEE